jgi:hypothetical protein
MGRDLLHLLKVSSPCAEICFASPRISRHRSSALILSTVRLKCTVLLSGEKTSVHR